MDRRRSVALILGLLLCLALGSWFVGVGKEDAPAVESPPAAASNTPAQTSEIQVSRTDPNDGSTAYQAPTDPPPAETTLSKGSIKGHLVGADGLTPIEGRASLADFNERSTVIAKTGSGGEFSFAHLEAGRYRLSGQGGGMNGQREIELSHNEQLEGIVLAMTPGHTLRGIVSGLRPEERTNAKLVVVAESGLSGLAQNSSIDKRGAYEVRGVAAGRIRIEASADTRGLATRFAQMPADGDLTVNLEFKPGARLTGRITLGGKPAAGVLLYPRSKSSDTQDRLFLSPQVTSQNGEYSYEDVPNGEYVFIIAAESYTSPTVRVSNDTVFDIEIPEVQLSGQVLEAGTEWTVAGADIHVRPTQQRSYGNRIGSSSDNIGQFGVRGLQPGDFVLTAYKPGYELYRAPLSYGTPISDMTIYMRPSQGVELNVHEADTDKAIVSVVVVENVNGIAGIAFQAPADRNGVSYLPGGLAGSALTFSAPGYLPTEVVDWNGQPLDLILRRKQ